MNRPAERGLTLVETLVSLVVASFVAAGLLTLIVHNSRVGKSQRLTAEVQSNARGCLALIAQQLRSAGWDPMNAGIPTVVVDPDPADEVSQIEIFADLDTDGTTDGSLEQTLIRHVGDRVEWKPSNAPGQPFEIVATNISNDADGDGIPEPMFVAQPPTDPNRVTVRVTAVSPVPDPLTGELARYTVESEIVLRKAL